MANLKISGINNPVLKSALAGSLSSGLSGGAAAFGTELLMGGDLESAWEAGKQGAKFGSIAGAVTGAYSGAKEVARQKEIQNTANAQSSARTEPVSLSEQLTLEEAQSGQGKQIMAGKTNDPHWQGWEKWQHSHRLPNGQNITIHYWRNPTTNELTGFKFKTPPTY